MCDSQYGGYDINLDEIEADDYLELEIQEPRAHCNMPENFIDNGQGELQEDIERVINGLPL